MGRRCSHCGQNGHNARTCPGRGVKLFGVRLDAGLNPTTSNILRKSSSTGNISPHSNSRVLPEQSISGSQGAGYVSDCVAPAKCRKKGVPWSEEEHRVFLMGLRAVGKGEWRAISKNFVTSRTPTQVASHAQKYFLRQSNLNKQKRRSSMFDTSPETCSSRVANFPLGRSRGLESMAGFSLEGMKMHARFGSVPCSLPLPFRSDIKPSVSSTILPAMDDKAALKLSIAVPSSAETSPNLKLSTFHPSCSNGCLHTAIGVV
ncbi:hypothetical protein SUGI_0904300 [Cryptomeria japonica]|nr:hypothetical protein SUGI_0904300 [Cryptomeria japonica]